MIVWVRSARALRLATISARIASTARPGPVVRRGPAGQRGPGGADRIERVGLALPPPVLPVGPVDFHDPDAGCG